jgi:DNA polymerase (family 10)
MAVENAHIAAILDEIADLIELKGGNQFRVRSYRDAARTVRGMSRRIEDLIENDGDLSDLANIGEGTAEKIGEIVETGTCDRLEELRQDVPEELTELLDLPDVGPRTAMQLHQELGVDSLEQLKKACEEHKVRELDGLGEKTEEKILQGIEMLSNIAGRSDLKAATERVESLRRHLDAIDGINRWVVAGSFRRRKETVGDLDVLIDATDRDAVTEQLMKNESIADVVTKGSERVTVRLSDGLQIDFRFFEAAAFGSAMLYFTGSKAHNTKLRSIAQDNGWKLNEYGLFKGDNRLAAKTEESVYQRLNLAWVPPELREDRGEIEAAQNGNLPDLIEVKHLRGDLHCHTTATDGADSIEAMAKAARDRGYDYLAITDHSKAVTVAGGLDNDDTRRHADEVRKVDEKLGDFMLLAGIEVDILKSGKLDLDEDLLADLDWVIASVHSSFDLSEKEMTNRLLKAIQSDVIHCIGHPFGRMIGKRDPMRFDVEAVFDACVDHGVRLEINAQPHRLDLPDFHCQRAVEAGMGLTISTDAHKASDLELIDFGVSVARRGWIEKADVLNTATRKSLSRRIVRR